MWIKRLPEPQIPTDACSPNIHKIFGTNKSIFELFVLKRKIMGPCWLTVKNVVMEHEGVGITGPVLFLADLGGSDLLV